MMQRASSPPLKVLLFKAAPPRGAGQAQGDGSGSAGTAVPAAAYAAGSATMPHAELPLTVALS